MRKWRSITIIDKNDIENSKVVINNTKNNNNVNNFHQKKIHTCEKCLTTFDHKSHFTKHLNRKTSCVPKEKEKQNIENRKCQWCFKVFKEQYIMRNHMPICKNKPSEVDELKHFIIKLSDKLNDQNDKLSKQNNKLDIITKKMNIPNSTTIIIDKPESAIEKKPKKKAPKLTNQINKF